MTPKDLKEIRERASAFVTRRGLAILSLCGPDVSEPVFDRAALLTEVDRLSGLLLEIGNVIYTADVNDHGACIAAMAKAREITTKQGATE